MHPFHFFEPETVSSRTVKLILLAPKHASKTFQKDKHQVQVLRLLYIQPLSNYINTRVMKAISIWVIQWVPCDISILRNLMLI